MVKSFMVFFPIYYFPNCVYFTSSMYIFSVLFNCCFCYPLLLLVLLNYCCSQNGSQIVVNGGVIIVFLLLPLPLDFFLVCVLCVVIWNIVIVFPSLLVKNRERNISRSRKGCIFLVGCMCLLILLLIVFLLVEGKGVNQPWKGE